MDFFHALDYNLAIEFIGINCVEDLFIIYIDRLKAGHDETISCTVPPDFMKIDENELFFPDEVTFSGKVYLTEEHLIIHIDIETTAQMPCKMCNELKRFPIQIKGHYYTHPLDEIKNGLFDLSLVIRELILLELPTYYECPQEECEGRAEAKKYLKKSDDREGNSYHPFADLEGI
ncbi:MAG: hypothetical protein K9M07_00280 [Simkaniaceae bacterium]|nr:hypothetical protein [Simkaniaceae bacterium]